jgi:hypothetical protein
MPGAKTFGRRIGAVPDPLSLSPAAEAFLCAPGLFCFLIGAPPWLSAALELAGLFSGAWIREERRRQLKEIATWEPEA